MASEKFNTQMDNLQSDSRAREGAQERRIQDMQEGLARFLATPCTSQQRAPLNHHACP